ncbi:MAG: hypothetical protein Q8S44_05130 [Flavobacteriaceae bacterium]|nr:hypothetical protein [Flavobacteriaceae bacterium]
MLDNPILSLTLFKHWGNPRHNLLIFKSNIMVKVIDFKTRVNNSGEEFFVLIVQGGAKTVVSKETGKAYFTVKKANVPTTFDEATCKSLIGQEFEGTIEKVASEPYEYVIESTGEIVELNYRYEFVTVEQQVLANQLINEELVA